MLSKKTVKDWTVNKGKKISLEVVPGQHVRLHHIVVHPELVVLHAEVRPLQQVLRFLQFALEEWQVTVDDFAVLLLVFLGFGSSTILMAGAAHFAPFAASILQLGTFLLPAFDSADVLFEGGEVVEVISFADGQSLCACAFGGSASCGELAFKVVEFLAAVLVIGALGHRSASARPNKH